MMRYGVSGGGATLSLITSREEVRSCCSELLDAGCSKKYSVFMKRKMFAFTLAEVLVTLGIIGVVSALTLPSLVKSHQRQVFVTQLHKVYNEFSQATEGYVTSRNAVDFREAGVRSQAGIQAFMQDRFKITKNCGSTFTNCFASSYENLDGSSVTNYADADTSCYALASGASVCLTYSAPRPINPKPPITLLVDTNGKSGPNILGRDLFTMYINRDGSVGSYAPRRITPTPKPTEAAEVTEVPAATEAVLGSRTTSGSSGYVINTSLNNITTSSAIDTAEKDLAKSKTDLEACQQANTMDEDAGCCFKQIMNDGWQMNY